MTPSDQQPVRHAGWSWHDQAPAVDDSGHAVLSDNARSQRRIWLLESLHAISHLIAGIEDINDNLQMLAEEIRSRFRFTAVILGVIADEHITFAGMADASGTMRRRIPITAGICGRVLRTGMGELVTDVASDPDYLPCSADVHRAIVIPIVVDGSPWGVLLVEADAKTVLDPEAYDVLYTLTTSLRQSISRARQRSAEQRRLVQLTGVQRIAHLIERGLNTTDEPDVLDAITTLLEYTHVGLVLVARGTEYIHVYRSFTAYLRGDAPVAQRRIGVGIVGRVLRTHEPAFVRDVSQDEDYAARIATTTQQICVPIRAGGEVLGVINAELDDRRQIDTSDLTVFLTIADHLGSAIANHLRIQDLERRALQLRQVEEVTRQIASMVNIRESLTDIVQQLEDIFAFSATGIGLLRRDRIFFSAYEGSFTLVPYELLRGGYPLNRGVTGRVARNGRAELILDVRDDPDYVATAPDIRYEACAPIITSSGVAGVINVETTVERPLDAGDLEIISIVAGHLGVALEKQDLYSAERRARVALEAMQRVSNIVASALDPTEALRVMTATLADAFGYPYVQISLLEGEQVVPAAYEGVPNAPPQAVAHGEGIIGRVAETEASAYVRDIGDTTEHAGALANVTSAIAVPVRHAGIVSGVLSVEGTAWRELTLEDLHLLQTFAEHAGTILHNAQVYARMEWLATRDPLTNLPNYREFRNRFRDALAHAQRHGTPVSLLVIDLDAFKQINDRFGHLAGDEALRTVARRLDSGLRAGDVLARYAGDEFVAILPNTERVIAETIAQRLGETVSAEPILLEDGAVFVQMSLGVATWPDNGATPDLLIDHADDLMYQVKRNDTRAGTRVISSTPPPTTLEPYDKPSRASLSVADRSAR